MTIPAMWVFALYGGGLPYMNDNLMDAITFASGVINLIGVGMYTDGYIEAPKKRMRGFQIRKKVAEFWLYGAVASVSWAALVKYGVVQGK